jgi:hypothetical protein
MGGARDTYVMLVATMRRRAAARQSRPSSGYCTLALFLLAGYASEVVAQGAPDSLQFAGVAFLANAASIEQQFPTAAALIQTSAERGRPLHGQLLQELRLAGVPVRTGLDARLGTALAFVFDDEYRTVQPYPGGQFKVVTVLSAQLLAVDFTDESVVASLPVIVEHVGMHLTAPGGNPSQEAVQEVVDDLLAHGVFAHLRSAFSGLHNRYPADCRTRIGRIEADTGTTSIGAFRFEDDAERLTGAVRAIAARYWSSAARQPLLPSGHSQARNQMMTRFANGDVYRLRIPEPDFEIHLLDIRTRRSPAGGNAARRIDATGVQAQLSVTETFAGSVIASGTFRLVTFDTVPAGVAERDAWPGFVNTLKSLVAGIGAAAREENAKWFRENDLAATIHPRLGEWLTRCGVR